MRRPAYRSTVGEGLGVAVFWGVGVRDGAGVFVAVRTAGGGSVSAAFNPGAALAVGTAGLRAAGCARQPASSSPSAAAQMSKRTQYGLPGIFAANPCTPGLSLPQLA